MRFLRRALSNAGWPVERVPSVAELLHVLGRIMSNNFAMYCSMADADVATLGREEGPGGNEKGADAGTPAAGGVFVPAPKLGCGEPSDSMHAALACLALETTETVPPLSEGVAAQVTELPGTEYATTAQTAPLSGGAAVDQAPRDTAVGRVVYSSASYFNHSCDPNCLVDRGLRRSTVTAQRAIQVHTRALCCRVVE